MERDEPQGRSALRPPSLSTAALIVAAGFLGSRVLGLLRSVIIAHAYGTSPDLDAYFVAFRLPDLVFQPSLHDIHQDHQTVATEGLRAFKRTTILGYEIPWNNFDFAYQAYFSLTAEHIERKVAALEKYASQQHRRYANAEYVRSVARTHGINVNREYAEVFQVYRVIA